MLGLKTSQLGKSQEEKNPRYWAGVLKVSFMRVDQKPPSL